MITIKSKNNVKIQIRTKNQNEDGITKRKGNYNR